MFFQIPRVPLSVLNVTNNYEGKYQGWLIKWTSHGPHVIVTDFNSRYRRLEKRTKCCSDYKLQHWNNTFGYNSDWWIRNCFRRQNQAKSCFSWTCFKSQRKRINDNRRSLHSGFARFFAPQVFFWYRIWFNQLSSCKFNSLQWFPRNGVPDTKIELFWWN